MAYGYVTVLDGFTIETWIKQNGAPGRWNAFVVQSTQADASWGTLGTDKGRQLWLGMNGAGALYFSIYDKTGVQRIAWTDPTPNDIIDNEWHHIAVRMQTNKRTFDLYIDGLPIATVSSGVDITWDAGSMVFAGHYQPKFGAYGVYLSPSAFAYFAVKDKMLSSNQIWDHYAAGNGGAVYYGDTEVQRINRVLDWAGMPEQSRFLDPALVNMQGVEVTGANALEQIQVAAEAAGGYVFADGQTRIMYHNRRRRYNKYSVFTFAESLGTAVELGLEFSMDDEWVYNDIRGDRPYGSNVRMLDQDSIDAYGRKVYKVSLPITSHEELRNHVGWLLSKYKQDRLRIDTVTIEASTSDTMHPAATGQVQIGDRITLDELPGHAPRPTMEFTIEGISVDIDFQQPHWKVTFNLSPAEFDRVFEIGVSELGGGDRIAF